MAEQLELMTPAVNPRFAAKTLTAVEVDPTASHQHEFHAGRLRTLLGFGPAKVRGSLAVLVYTGDTHEPVLSDKGTFTLYDAREDSEERSEWHLYYSSTLIGRHARPGDLLVLFRPDERLPDLRAVVARAGTEHEAQLRQLLALGSEAELLRFSSVKPTAPDPTSAEKMAFAETASRTFWEKRFAHCPMLRSAVEKRAMPRPRQLADAAHQEVLDMLGANPDADEFLVTALEAESALFFATEHALGELELNELLASGAGFAEVVDFSIRKTQARKSRRGLSLQFHVEKLFELRGIPFSAQCETEAGEKPDFIIPSCAAYHDPHFPNDRLRMVGCKSRIRERWGQYLKEAARIRIKYHVSIDETISEEALRKMYSHSLRLFMPRALISRYYANRGGEHFIQTIGELLDALVAATGL